MYVDFYRLQINSDEIQEVLDTLRSGWLTTGPKTKLFEKEFARAVCAKNAIAVNSCTAALHLAMHVAGVGDGEVITPSLTFISTNHAILYNRGIPVFADVEEDTFNVDPRDIEDKITPQPGRL